MIVSAGRFKVARSFLPLWHIGRLLQGMPRGKINQQRR